MAMAGFINYLQVPAHGKTIIEVTYTNMAQQVDLYIANIQALLEKEPEKIVGLDVEYTDEHSTTQKAAVIQLCMGTQCLVYQISAADRPCP